MRRIQSWLMAVSLVALAAARGSAQQSACEKCGRVMGPPPLMLLAQKSVQAELKLSDDQVKKVGEALAGQRAEFQKLRALPREEREKKFAELFETSRKLTKEIVTPEQGQRLRQIHWQQQGALAFGNPRVAEALHLSDEQKEKIEAIHKEARETAGKFFAQDPPPAREDIHRTMKELRKTSEAKTMALITEEQKAKWQEMLGTPFTGEIHHERHAQ
jgi:acyl-CoA reductase-like NAD-dependent aldehyde dehydrogenase